MFTSAKTARFQHPARNCHGPGSAAHVNGSNSASTSALRAAPATASCCATDDSSGRVRHSADGRPRHRRGARHRRSSLRRCHWRRASPRVEQNDFSKQIQGAAGNATVAEMTALGMTRASVHPQTCVTCHDPHAQGTLSGEPNTATVRISGDTGMLPAGFKATGVGHGALCITCHNTRNGAHNDNIALASYSGPHAPSQGDALMGQNFYFVTPGKRGGHSYITDTCTTCHMVLSDPPAEYSYQKSGTNHSFKADPGMCSNCHGTYDGGTLQTVVAQGIVDLEAHLGEQPRPS
jgi:hypothetical protein